MLPIAIFAIDNALAVRGQGVGSLRKLYMLISGARKRETLAFAKSTAGAASFVLAACPQKDRPPKIKKIGHPFAKRIVAQ
jgi:hypothetical protein